MGLDINLFVHKGDKFEPMLDRISNGCRFRVNDSINVYFLESNGNGEAMVKQLLEMCQNYLYTDFQKHVFNCLERKMRDGIDCEAQDPGPGDGDYIPGCAG